MKNKNNQKIRRKQKTKPKEPIEKVWKIGDTLIYIKTNEEVELVKIHYDDIVPYYTIRMEGDKEKQTTIDNLTCIK